MNNCEKAFGIRPKKIVLTGDSAGGNLALAVAMLAVETGFRLPDGLMIVYPVVNVSIRLFSPSMLLSFDDILLP